MRGAPVSPHVALTHQQVADLLALRGDKITKQRVFQIERKALMKIKSHPAIVSLAIEYGLTTEGEADARVHEEAGTAICRSVQRKSDVGDGGQCEERESDHRR